jgi:hypothetical protein
MFVSLDIWEPKLQIKITLTKQCEQINYGEYLLSFFVCCPETQILKYAKFLFFVGVE